MVLFQSVQTGSRCLLLTETDYRVSAKKKKANFTAFLWWTQLTSSFLRYATLSQEDFINIVQNHFKLTQLYTRTTLANLSIWVLYKMSYKQLALLSGHGSAWKKALQNSNSVDSVSWWGQSWWILRKEKVFPHSNHNKTENDISFLPTWSLKIFEITTGTLCSAPPWKAEETSVKCLNTCILFFSPSLCIRRTASAYFDAQAQTAIRLSSQYNSSVL